MPRRNLVTQQKAADYLGITDRSVRNLISRGELTGFKLRGVRAVRVDMNEVEALVDTVPTRRQKQREQRQVFGPKATIVTVAETVDQ